jgi:hypothetical protein
VWGPMRVVPQNSFSSFQSGNVEASPPRPEKIVDDKHFLLENFFQCVRVKFGRRHPRYWTKFLGCRPWAWGHHLQILLPQYRAGEGFSLCTAETHEAQKPARQII